MQIKHTHPLIVWAQFGELSKYRDTTLCALLAHVLIIAPFKFAAMVAIGAGVFTATLGAPLFGLLIWAQFGIFEFSFFAGLAGVTFFFVAAVLWAALEIARGDERFLPDFVQEAYSGCKNKFCPIVRIER